MGPRGLRTLRPHRVCARPDVTYTRRVNDESFQIGPWRQIAEGVHVARLQPESVNVGLVVGDERVLLIDTGSSPEQGRQLAASVRKLLGRGVDVVVITHWHHDHWFGLAGFEDVQSIGHASLIGRVTSSEVEEAAAELGFDADDVVAPNDTMFLAKMVDLGSRRVEIVHLGSGHTDGDVIVNVPDAGVIFTGDLFETAGDPHFGDDCVVREWPLALDGVLGSSREDTLFVPGHGEPGDQADVFDQRGSISMMFSLIEDLVLRGTKLEQALHSVDTADPADEWPFTLDTVRSAMPVVYAELAALDITPRTQLPLAGH